MASEDRVLITAAQAEGLLADGERVHNYANPAGGMLIGCDYDRAEAVAALRSAKEIEIAGPGAKSIRHPLAVWEADGRVTFFEADMEKVEAFEAAIARARKA